MLTHEHYNIYNIHMLWHEHLLMLRSLIHSWFLLMQTDIWYDYYMWIHCVKLLGLLCASLARRGSLGYLKGNGPMNKDYWSPLGLYQEFWINVNSIFEETEKVLLKDRTMLIRDLVVFSGPIDDSRGILRGNSICSKSLIWGSIGRINRTLRWIQCFVRLGMIT